MQYEIGPLLKKINSFRVATGLQPLEDIPKGTKWGAYTCPIARALNHHCKVYGSKIVANQGIGQQLIAHNLAQAPPLQTYSMLDLMLDASYDIRRFVYAFDAGQLPQYDTNAAS